MIKNKKKFWITFVVAFAATVVVMLLMVFVVFKSAFYGIYVKRGNAAFEAAKYTDAAKQYTSAKNMNGKKQEIYLLIAKAYSAYEDYDNAGAVIDEAIAKKIITKDTGLEQLYLMRIKIFSAAGKPVDAAKYIDSLTDQYMLKKIQDVRPGDLAYTPNQGSYDKTLKMSITVREGETVYYTTDGTDPTKFSNVYIQPINIGNGTTSVTAISVDADGLVSPLLKVSYTVSNENEAVSFEDSKIERMARVALSKPNGSVRVKELEGIVSLTNLGVEGNVKTLSDLELMPNLQTLYLDNESMILSISQLSGRTKLSELSLSGCSLDSTDINALGALTALETLDLSNNQITSVSALSGLTSLKFVYLERNSIDDISVLSAAKSLVFIDASDNRITAIPDFVSTGELTTLILSKNRITDMSTVHRLTSLTYLDISANQITSAKNLSALTKLEALDISGNKIANFDFLGSLSLLKSLNVSDTSFVSTKPIAKLDIITLTANETGLASLTDIGKFKNLTGLAVASTNVTDLSPLKNSSTLDYLDISGCAIKDLSPLSTMTALFTLEAQGLDLSSVQFKNKDINIVT